MTFLQLSARFLFSSIHLNPIVPEATSSYKWHRKLWCEETSINLSKITALGWLTAGSDCSDSCREIARKNSGVIDLKWSEWMWFIFWKRKNGSDFGMSNLKDPLLNEMYMYSEMIVCLFSLWFCICGIMTSILSKQIVLDFWYITQYDKLYFQIFHCIVYIWFSRS